MSNENKLLQSPEILIPTTLDELISLKKQFGSNCTYVAGATLLQLRWQIAQTMPQRLIHLEQITSLQQYELNENSLTIGANTKLSALRFDPNINRVCPAISSAIQSIAAPAVRNRGTVGGNIMGGEGDLIPLFLAMKAEMTFLQEGNYQIISMVDWLPNRQSNDSLLVNITIPLHVSTNTLTFYKKIGRRETFTAAVVTVAGQASFTDLYTISEVRLAIGGGGNKPIRLHDTEQYLVNKGLEHIDWKAVYQSILEQYNPATDAFVTGKYKQKVAANLIVSALQGLFKTATIREEPVYEM